MSLNLVKKLKKIPNSSGIYLFYNKKKELVYVGKATSLKSRVRSYFSNYKKQITNNKRPIEMFVEETVDIKWIVTDSVLEAIILEANYIKKYLPKYNVEGRDDKSWNYFCISKDLYPRVIAVRKHELDLQRKKRLKDYKIIRLEEYAYVFGPYPGLNTKATMKLLQRLFFISTCKVGKQNKPCFYHQLGQCMGVCTGAISATEYKRKVIRPLVTFLKGGKKRLITTLERRMKKESEFQNYEEAARLRNQIKALNRIHDIALLNKSFVENDELRIMNYELRIMNYELRIGRIEGYDISNLGASGKVGSMVVFVNGEADKKQYRKFKIKTVKGQNDVDCLDEVIRRRLKHFVKSPKSKDQNQYWPLPDLFLIDGGKPQVNRVYKVLKLKSLKVPIVGIAKGKNRNKNEFVFAEKKEELIEWVRENKDILIQVRDEAHRFAIAYQKKLRKIKR